MSVQQQHTSWTGYLSAGTSVAVGDVVCLNPTGTAYVKATTAALAAQSLGVVGVAVTAGDTSNPAFELQFCGLVPASVTGLGAGAAGSVYVSATGRLSRTLNGSSIGTCNTVGDALVTFAAGGVSSVTLPFNVASPSPVALGPGQEWISYGQSGDTLPDVSNTVGSLIRLGDSVGASGDYYGIITWETPGGNSENVLSVAYNSGSLIKIGGESGGSPTGQSTAIFGGQIVLKSFADQLYFVSDGSNWDGIVASRRIAVGSIGTSNHASFGGTAAGPMIKLHEITTMPTGNPVGNPNNPAIWLYYENAASDVVTVHFPSGNKFRLPDTNGTAGTSSLATNGANNDLLTSNGSGGFGTAITPASGIATFLATPSSANLRSALTDETGTGAAVFATSPSLTTPTLSSPAVTGTPSYATGALTIKTFTGVINSTSTSATTLTGCEYTMADDTYVQFDAIVTFARRSAVTKAGTYKLSVGYRRTGGGAPTIVGALVTQTDQETEAGNGATINVTSNTVRVQVTNADTDDRNWGGEFRVQELTDA